MLVVFEITIISTFIGETGFLCVRLINFCPSLEGVKSK